MACFIKTAATCTKHKVVIEKTADDLVPGVGVVQRTTTTAYEIVGGTPQRCTLVITPLDQRLVIDEKVKAALKAQGTTLPSAVALSADARAKENIMECTKPAAALVQVLQLAPLLQFKGGAWAECLHPFAKRQTPRVR